MNNFLFKKNEDFADAVDQLDEITETEDGDNQNNNCNIEAEEEMKNHEEKKMEVSSSSSEIKKKKILKSGVMLNQHQQEITNTNTANTTTILGQEGMMHGDDFGESETESESQMEFILKTENVTQFF